MNKKSESLLIAYDFSPESDVPRMNIVRQDGLMFNQVAFYKGEAARKLYEQLTGESCGRTYMPKKVMFPTKETPTQILDMLMRDIDEYGWVSVSDFYKYARVTSPDKSRGDIQFGWVNLTSANVFLEIEPQNGYYICFPPAIDLAGTRREI